MNQLELFILEFLLIEFYTITYSPMNRERTSVFEPKGLYKPISTYEGKKGSQYYSRDPSPQHLEPSETYRIPQFPNQSYKINEKPRNTRAPHNMSFEGKPFDYRSRMQLSDRKGEKKLIDHHYRFVNYQKENKGVSGGIKESNQTYKNHSFKSQLQDLTICEEEIFSFKELVDPSFKQLTPSRKASTNQSSPVARKSGELKINSFDFMNNFLSENRFKGSEFGKKRPTEKDFTAIKMMGKGKYSRSYLVREKYTNFVCVLKQINKEAAKKSNMMERVVLEIKTHASLKHPNIIDFYGVFETETDICLILEYAEQGKLSSIIKGFEQVPQALISHYTYDIGMALQYIHSKKIIHRDIKPDNILLSNGVIKISDFSWATPCSHKKSVFCGTIGYAPPEVSELNQYNESIDLWGLGVILYELATGRVWVNSVEETLQNKMMRRQLELPSRLSFDLKDLIQGLLRKDPLERLTLQEIWRHPFIKRYNK